MLSVDLSGKNAFVTGVSDDAGFAWQIAKVLQAAGADVYLACHPRVVSIVERFVGRTKNQESRALPHGVEGEFKPKAIIPCDAEFDRWEDVPEERRTQKGYADAGDFSIDGAYRKYSEASNGASLDIVIHSVAFSPEIKKSHLETSRAAYLMAHSVSAYSLVAMTRMAIPLMGESGSVVGLSYLAANRAVPNYGGGMASAKAALECDARQIAWFAGEKGIRVNIVSAGPYASRAARSIGDIGKMMDEAAKRSPLRRPITGQEVADTTLFLCSPLASGISGSVVYVDAGYHAMAITEA